MRGPGELKPTKLNLLFLHGGLGDTIARLPAVKYILDHYQHVTHITVVLQQYAVEFAEHVFQEYQGRVTFKGVQHAEEVFNTSEQIPGMYTDSKHHTTLRAHLSAHAFHTLVDEMPLDMNAYNYLPIYPNQVQNMYIGPKPYVVITTGFTAPVREWRGKHVNETVKWLKQTGYNVVFLGRKEAIFDPNQTGTLAAFSDEIDYSVGTDMREQTSLLEAARIMWDSAAVVGVDNGLLHLAASTPASIVAGYTAVTPHHRLPIRFGEVGFNCYVVEPLQSLGCKYCQTQLNFVYKIDHRRCYYNDYQCLDHMNSMAFIRELKKCLNLAIDQ